MRRPAWTVVAAAVVVGLGVAGCAEVVPEESPPAGTPSPTAAPRVPILEQAGTIAGAGSRPYAVFDGVLAVLESDQLVGYQLPAGEPVWTAPLPAAEGTGRVQVGAGQFMVAYSIDREWHTMVVAPASGAVHWQEPGLPLATAADGELVIAGAVAVALEQVGPGRSQGTEATYTYWARRADTGAAVWTVTGTVPPTPDLTYLRVSESATGPPDTRTGTPAAGQSLPQARWLVLDEADGALSVIDPGTGDQRPLVPAGRTVMTGLSSAGVRLVGDLALVRYWDGEEVASIEEPVALDLATGAERWTLAATDHGFGQPPSDCGVVICLAGFVGAGQDRYDTYGLDPQTGEVVWTEDVARVAGPAAPGWPGSPLLALHHRILGADDLEMGVHLHDQQARLLDPGSGDLLLDLTGWKPLGADGSWLLTYADLADVDWETVTAEQIVADLAVAVVDLETRTIHEVGSVPDVVVYQTGGIAGLWRFPQETYLGCRAAAGWLLCQHADGDLTVWRYVQQE